MRVYKKEWEGAKTPEPVPFNPTAPLERIVGHEGRRANAALVDYYHMGEGRSIAKLLELYRQRASVSEGYQPPSLKKSTMYNWSVYNCWQLRVTAQKKLEAEQAELEWRRYQDELRSKERESSDKLLELAEKILSESPKFVRSTRRLIAGKRDEQGRQLEPDREIVTVALDARLALQALELFSKLGRSAAGMDKHQVNLDIDMSKLTYEQLVRISNGEDPLQVVLGG